MIDIVYLYLINDLLRVLQRLRDIGEDSRHLFRRLEPLLLRIVHAVHIVDEVVRTQADQPVMRLGVLFVHEMRIVGGDDFDAVLMRQVNEDGVHLFLPFIDFRIASLFLRLMALDLDIIVLAEEVFEPFHRLFRFRKITALGDAFENLLR